MHSLLEILLMVILLINIFVLGAGRIHSVIRAMAFQGILLGVMLPLVDVKRGLIAIPIAVAVLALKGVVIPAMLMRAMRDVRINREMEPIIGLLPCMVLCALGTGLAVVFSNHFPMVATTAPPLVIPAAFSTILTGFLMLITRRKAVSMVIGYLSLENGIFLFGLTLFEALPFLVEIGVMLDLLVGIFIIGIIVDYINRTFSSLDTRRLSSLKD